MARKKRKWTQITEAMEEEIAAYATRDKVFFAVVMRDLLREALAVRRERRPGAKLLVEENGKRREIVVI